MLDLTSDNFKTPNGFLEGVSGNNSVSLTYSYCLAITSPQNGFSRATSSYVTMKTKFVSFLFSNVYRDDSLFSLHFYPLGSDLSGG